MALTHEKRLERFIRQQAFGSHDEKLEGFLFYHSPQGGKQKLLEERKCVDGITEDEIDTLVEEFMGVLENDARGMGGMQRYVIEPKREGGGAATGRFIARIWGDEEADQEHGDGLDTEGPTTRGIVAQSMRHTEAIMKTSMGSVGVVMGTLQKMVTQQAEVIQRLTQERFDNLAVMEEAYMAKHTREMEMLVAGSAEERKDKLIEQISAMIPVAANKLMGKKLLPESTTPREQMLRNVISTMDREQLNAVTSVLRPDQQLALFELIQAFQAEEEAKKGKTSNGET